ncbi:MAG: hypothetical protein U9N81_04460 [Bacillota bacterium]|nr:hypothetical protein [Bacillota bacterium]
MLGDLKEDVDPDQDYKTLSWATNENDEKLYFMVERYVPQTDIQSMVCRLYFDINENGSYGDLIDKYAQLTYQPRMEGWGDVEVDLYTMTGERKGKYAGRWGGISKGQHFTDRVFHPNGRPAGLSSPANAFLSL